jgi:hypothetical protein
VLEDDCAPAASGELDHVECYSWDETLQLYCVEFEGSKDAMVTLVLPPVWLAAMIPTTA